MTAPRDPDAILGSWLDEGPTRLPDATRRAIAVHTRSTRQSRRPLGVPWRFFPMNPLTRTAVAVLSLVVVVGGFTYLFRPGEGIGVGPAPAPTPTSRPSPTAEPSASPSRAADAAIDTSGWVTYSSERYGYDIKHPADWEATAATRDWILDRDRTDWLSPAQDRFIDNESADQIGVHVFAADLPAGMTADRWIDTYLAGDTEGAACPITAAEMPTITVGGYEGKLADQPACSDAIAVVPVGRRVYGFTVGRENQLPLFEAFLSTVDFKPGAASRLSAHDWTAYTSGQYGFTVGHPADWTVAPATRAWNDTEDATDPLTTAADVFQSPGGDVRVSVWIVPGPVPEESSEAIEAWVKSYCAKTDLTSCDVIHDRAEQLCIEIRDCHPGLLVSFDGTVQAFTSGGISAPGGVTVVSVRQDADAATAPYGGSKRLLEAFLGTMGVWPEDRRPTPQEGVWPPQG